MKEVIVILDRAFEEKEDQASALIAGSALVHAVIEALGEAIPKSWKYSTAPLDFKDRPVSFAPDRGDSSDFIVRVTSHAGLRKVMEQEFWQPVQRRAGSVTDGEGTDLKPALENVWSRLRVTLGLPVEASEKGALRVPGDLIIVETRMLRSRDKFCTPHTWWYMAQAALALARREVGDLAALEEEPESLPRVLLVGWKDAFLSFVQQCQTNPALGTEHSHFMATFLAESLQEPEDMTWLPRPAAADPEGWQEILKGILASGAKVREMASPDLTRSGRVDWTTALLPFLWAHFPDLFLPDTDRENLRRVAPIRFSNMVNYADPLWPDWVVAWIRLLQQERVEENDSRKMLDMVASRRIRHWYYVHLAATHLVPLSLRALSTVRAIAETADAKENEFPLLKDARPGEPAYETAVFRGLKSLSRAIRSDLHGSKASHDIHGDLFNAPWPAPLCSLVRRVFELRDWFDGPAESSSATAKTSRPKPPRFVFVDNAAQGAESGELNEKLYGIFRVIECLCPYTVRVGLPRRLERLIDELGQQLRGNPSGERQARTQALIDKLAFIKRRVKDDVRFHQQENVPSRHASLDFCLYQHDFPPGPGRLLRDLIHDHILKREGDSAFRERRYLFLDFILASPDSKDEVVYLGHQFLQDLVWRKEKLQILQARDPKNNWFVSAGPEWGMIVSKHNFNTNAYIDSGVFNFLFGHVSLHPGENPISLIRRIPFLLKVVSLIESNLHRDVENLFDQISDALRRARSASRSSGAGNLRNLKGQIATLVVSLENLRHMQEEGGGLPRKVRERLLRRLLLDPGNHNSEQRLEQQARQLEALVAGLEHSLYLHSKSSTQRALTHVQAVIEEARDAKLSLVEELGDQVREAIEQVWSKTNTEEPV